MIIKKLSENLIFNKKVKTKGLTLLFTCYSMEFILKLDQKRQKIYHFFEFYCSLVNDYLSNKKEKLQYTRFQKMLQLVIQIGKNYIILKKNIEDIYRNIQIAF